ncbi:MAG: transcription elongation factor GreA [Rhodospirillales bacterium]|nr:transcription elongation factor GreA [Rhodospirillales bacterium]MBI2978967.1 transcription elongation factor GreA [Rhodospirillales bacterium]
MDKVPMTADGLKSLHAELDRLKNRERPAISKALEAAREHGDIAENAEYHAAKERQSFVEGRLAELEDVISRADVIDVSKLSGSTVKFGATVMLADGDTDDEVTYMIVGSHEANASNGRLSITSPLARALIGKTAGDVVEVSTPSGGKSYEIIEVTFVAVSGE